MSLLPVEPAWRLAERKEEHRWLIAGLWSEQAVGIIGGDGAAIRRRAALRRRGRTPHRAPAARRHLCRRRSPLAPPLPGHSLTAVSTMVVSRIFRTFDQATASVCANSPPLRADACIPAAARCGGGAVGYGSICPTCTISPITANETHARTMIQSASLTMACDFRGQATPWPH